jgi:hypothetical protein
MAVSLGLASADPINTEARRVVKGPNASPASALNDGASPARRESGPAVIASPESMAGRLPFRVFLSSPGDVPEERKAARAVIEKLRADPAYKDDLDLDVVAWDDPSSATPLSGTLPPQEAVNRYNPPPSACELTLVILWARMGTPLAAHTRKPDGTTYASGTEWELEDARQAGKEVFVYHRNERPQLFLDDPEFGARLQQYEAVKAFLAGLRASRTAGVNACSAAQFPTLVEQHLRRHLTQWIKEARERGQSQPLGPSEEPEGFGFFLAATAVEAEVSPLSQRLGRRLRREPDTRISDGNELPAPLTKEQHAARVIAELKRADLSVHLLGREPGDPVDWGEAGRTTVLEQAELALAHARSMLILHPPGFAISGVADGPYRQFLEQLNANGEERERLERVHDTDPNRLIERVLDKRRILEEARRRARVASARTALIEVDARDLERAGEVQDYLLAKNVTPQILPEDRGSPGEVEARFAERLRPAHLFLVIYDKAPYAWVKERIKRANNIIFGHDLFTKVGVYLGAGQREKPQFPVPVIDHPSKLDDLLSLA